MRKLENSTLYIFTHIITNIFNLINTSLVAHTLSIIEYGTLQNIYSNVTLIFNILSFGIINSTISNMLMYKKEQEEYISSGFILILGVSIVNFLMMLLFLKAFKDKLLPFYFLLLTSLNLLLLFFNSILVAKNELIFNNTINLLSNFFLTISIAILFLIKRISISNILFFQIISLFISILFLYKKTIPEIRLSIKSIREIIKSSKDSFLNRIITTLTTLMTKPILGIISLEQLANYSISYTYAQILLIIQSAIKSLLFSPIGNLSAEKKISELSYYITLLFDVTLKIITPIGAMLIFLAPTLINFLFGSKYSNIEYFVAIIISGTIINFLSITNSAIFIGMKKLKEMSIINFIKSLVYVPALFVLVNYFAGIGACISYLFLSMLNLMSFLFIAWRINLKVKITKKWVILLQIIILLIFFKYGKNLAIILEIIDLFIIVKYNFLNKDTKKLLIYATKTRKYLMPIYFLIK